MGVLWDLIFKEILHVSEVTMPVPIETVCDLVHKKINEILTALQNRVVWEDAKLNLLCSMVWHIHGEETNENFHRFCELLITSDQETPPLSTPDAVLREAMDVRTALGVV